MKNSVASRPKRKWLKFAGWLAIVFLLMQWIHPKFENPPVTGDFQAPDEVKSIIKRSCYNCHSNEVRLSWYDRIEPVYWQVAAHIRDGRAVLNFSHWDSLAPGDQNAKLWEAVNQIIYGVMPLSQYSAVHREAIISGAEMAVLKNYLLNKPVIQPSDSLKKDLLEKQYKLLANHDTLTSIPQALNGISYMPEYKHWQIISSTDRYDNGTLRAIMGNDMAVKAVAENKMHPWPNGTIFAKVAWNALQQPDGELLTGPFIQVEYMIKDDQKYASTRGWGFARFKTASMVPYGKNALFASECVNCHQPMKENDFVFTIPVIFRDSPAKINNPVWRLLNTSVNKKDSTMSWIFANEKDSSLTRLVWKQKEDDHWFGGRIAGSFQRTEKMPFNKTDSILSMHASVLP